MYLLKIEFFWPIYLYSLLKYVKIDLYSINLLGGMNLENKYYDQTYARLWDNFVINGWHQLLPDFQHPKYQ